MAMERAEGSLSWYSVTDGIGGVNTSILCGTGAWLRDMKERMQGRPLIGLRLDVLCGGRRPCRYSVSGW